MSAPVTRNLTILLTDIKGFTDKTSHKSRAEIQEMLESHKRIVLPILEGRGGRLIKTIGDAFLMVFESPTNAVLAGVAVQEALAEHNRDKPAGDRLEIRIAINQGEVNLADDDIFGEPVNITARIEAVAEAKEVFFTEAVYLAMNKTEVPSSEVGLLQLKGIPEKIRVYKVRREQPVGGLEAAGGRKLRLFEFLGGSSPPPPPASGAPAAPPPLWRRAAAFAVDALLCLVLLGVFIPDPDKTVLEAAKVKASARGLELKGRGLNLKVDAKGELKELDLDGYFADKKRQDKRRGKALPLVWLLYGTLFVSWLGATPGKKFLGLRIVGAAGGAPGWKEAAIRSGASLASFYLLLLGYLWALRERERLTWHDLAAKTRVVAAE